MKGILLGIVLFIVGGISYVGIRIGIGLYRVAGTAGGTQYDIQRFRLLHCPVLWAVRPHGRFAIVGTYVKDENGLDQGVSSILDTPISVQADTRDALTTIRVILDALNAKSRIQQVVPGTMAHNALRQSQVNVGGENIPARTLLLQALSAAKIKLYWHLYYDHDVDQYALNVVPLMKANYDASGNRATVLVR